MSGNRLRTIRQHLHVTMPAGVVDVHTRPDDYHQFAALRQRHGWPTAEEDPVGFLMFLTWHAARRDPETDTGLTLEKFRSEALDVAELEPEPITPTPPAPGAG
ncbi:hypothetical protein [Cellulomonas sp. URHB0016]